MTLLGASTLADLCGPTQWHPITPCTPRLAWFGLWMTPLTEGCDLKSRVIGNSRGVYVSAGKHELMLVAYLDFGFTSGKLNGSSISVLLRNPVRDVDREFRVVGGRGKFRMARGFCKLKCIFFQ
ncbi:hypothetical protein Pyn_25233 [Prunus yedoensis var. nudiflora]|uniref:Dirigent protein n=1 Tax=Prunus yedoensis var. nudiflora TaxID=2094558 RepID=A0A314Y584_PRUYE|nr:hypothetical protein Pyn_25233 [Prunus yedoensis var. nudiflora]